MKVVRPMSQPPRLTQASRVRVVLYVALVVSAATALLGMEELESRVREGSLPLGARWLPAVMFAVALALYAVDRVLLVRNRHYPSGKAFLQVAGGMALFTALLPGPVSTTVLARMPADGKEDTLLELLRHQDPRVRALACEVAGARGNAQHMRLVEQLLKDPAPAVQQAARAAVQRGVNVNGATPGQDGGQERAVP